MMGLKTDNINWIFFHPQLGKFNSNRKDWSLTDSVYLEDYFNEVRNLVGKDAGKTEGWPYLIMKIPGVKKVTDLLKIR